jgi:hypothetical protein
MAVDERDRLRTQNDRLLDDLTKLKRVEHGLRETPRVPKPELQKPPAIPPGVQRLYKGRCQSPAMESEIERQVLQMYGQGTPFDQIEVLLSLQLGEPESEGVN